MANGHIGTIEKYFTSIINGTCFQIPTNPIKKLREGLREQKDIQQEIQEIANTFYLFHLELLDVHRIIKHAYLQLQTQPGQDYYISNAEGIQLAQKILNNLISLENQIENIAIEAKKPSNSIEGLTQKGKEILSLFEDFLANYAIIKATLSS